MLGKESQTWWKPEFVLVVIMFIVLTVLVVAVLLLPIGGIPSGDTVKYTDILDYRKSILAIILTAFGAWVGAGAAYFFGRENLRQSAENMLAMREPSPKERLRRILVREIPLKSIDWFVKTSDEVKVVIDKLRAEPQRWFIPIIKDDGSLETIIHEEGVWRFLLDKEISADISYTDFVKKKNISDVLAFLKEPANEDLKKNVQDIHVRVTLDKSAGDTYELMESKGVRLAVITDEKGKPTHFFDLGDVRRVLLQLG